MEIETLLSIYPKPLISSTSPPKGQRSPSKASSKNTAVILGLIEGGHVLPGRDDHVLRAMLDEESFLLLDCCLLHMEYLPEWFLARCCCTIAPGKDKKKYTSSQFPKDFASHLLTRSFDHAKMVKELRNLPFGSVLALAELVLEEIEERRDSYSLELFAWASVLVESHSTEWTLADDSHETLFRLNDLLNDQIESMFLWEEVQGRVKALLVASKTADSVLKEDVKYWHSLLEF